MAPAYEGKEEGKQVEESSHGLRQRIAGSCACSICRAAKCSPAELTSKNWQHMALHMA